MEECFEILIENNSEIINVSPAVKSSFKKSRPTILKLMRPSFVGFADASNARQNIFPAIYKFYSCLSEEKVNIFIILQARHKVGS